MTKSIAKIAGFDSWEKGTNHGNRACALTKMIENGAPLEDRMTFMRHKSANSQQPYARATSTRETNKHLALRADGDGDSKPPAVPKPVTKNTHGFQMGGGPSSLATVPPNVERSEWEAFQQFKAMNRGEQCPSVAAPPAQVPSSIQVASTMAPMMDMSSMMNPMAGMMSPMPGMMMNPMSSMMGMGMMNPMMGMGMMNPMMGMMANPMSMNQNQIAMGVAMGMQIAQRNNGTNPSNANGIISAEDIAAASNPDHVI